MLEFGKLAKIGNAGFVTADLDRLAAYYRDVIGFSETERSADTVYLTSGQDHHTVALRKGDQDELSYISFQLAGDVTLEEAADALAASGVDSELKSDAEPGISQLLEFDDPEGNTLRIFKETALSGAGFSGRGIGPQKLGHICIRSDDVPGLCEWYEQVLGFRWSDWIGDFFVFVRLGADHHTVNLLKGPAHGNVLHHIAYELRDFNHVQPACDELFRNGFKLVWGPGRHGPGHNIYTYHRDPDGHLVELFCQLDVVNERLGEFEPRPWHEDNPQRPKRWTPDPLAPNRWGITPPDGFM
jgi:catechol 2,3-dioxygenase-like lactoylglutathione lyase family enzyme